MKLYLLHGEIAVDRECMTVLTLTTDEEWQRVGGHTEPRCHTAQTEE